MERHYCASVKNIESQPKALLVEDSEVCQIVHRFHLKELGFQVDLAEDGYKALELVAQSDYYCALLDLGLPDISGESVLSAIRHREQKTGKHLLIIVNSADADERVFERCRQQGADATLPKPLLSDDLSRVLASINNHHAEDTLA